MPPRQPNVLEQLNHRMGLTKDELDELAAKTVFVDCLRPEALHKTGMLAFLQALRQPNSSYKPPSRSTILEAWLPRIYEDVRKKVLDEVIAPASMLNVIFDASDDASGHRQVNISIATPEYPAVFWTLVDTGSTRHAAPQMADIVRDKIQELVDDGMRQDWSRINAFISDTCSTAIATCRELTQRPGLEHAFSVFCDSHGLQLLVKDLFNQPGILKERFQKCMSVVGVFTTSPLQLARLRDEQLRLYGKTRAIATGSFTRWGSHLRALESLMESKDALKTYAVTIRTMQTQGQLDRNEFNSLRILIGHLISSEFWMHLEGLIDILKPISEAIKMSEADRSTIGYVAKRWMGIKDDWRTTELLIQDVDWPDIPRRHELRMNRQVTDINWLAYALNPTLFRLTDQQKATASQQIRLLASDPDMQLKCQVEFLEFRVKSNRFHANRTEWSADVGARLFWMSFLDDGSKLAVIACRVFGCIANSVPAERAFSSMNFIENKLSSRLTSDKLNMWAFIYINSRVLKRLEEQKNSPNPRFYDENGSVGDEIEDQEETDGLMEQFLMAGAQGLTVAVEN